MLWQLEGCSYAFSRQHTSFCAEVLQSLADCLLDGCVVVRTVITHR